jgi:hypothetical protein
MKSSSLSIVACLCIAPISHGAINVLSPTDDWTALTYVGVNVVSDYTEDVQATSADLDLVGDVDHAAVYTNFDSAGDSLGFRFRMGGDQNPAGFSGQVWVGADVNDDGNLDIFIGANDTAITVNYASDGENISPSTTTIDTKNPISSIPISGTNYSWTPVTLGASGNDPDGLSADIDGDLNTKNKSGNDYFLTFTLNFSAFEAAANGLSYISGFTSASSIAYVTGTATQGNTLNSDLNGISGGTNDGDSWVSLGAITPEMGVDGVLVPEPASTATLIGALCLLFIGLHKRRS